MYNLQPLKNYLHIFQLEEYKVGRLISWLLRTLGKKPKEVKKDIVWTNKAKFIYISSLFLFLISSSILANCVGIFLSSILIVILWLNNYLFIIISALLLKIYEVPNKIKTVKKIRQKVDNLKKLKIISITGSAGKTSTKNILYQLLTKKVLSTPFSYNTLFGIAKVIDYELNNYYDYFIAEMGAYKRGDIRELCKMTPPDVSILTTINTQHLERFGSLKNTINAKFEILQYMKPNGVGIVNRDNSYSKENLDKANVKLIG